MDHRRLILFLIFSFSIVMLWDAWQRYNNPQPLPVAAGTTTPQPSAPLNAPAAAGTPPAAGTAAPVVAAAPAAEKVAIKTDLYTATISAAGGELLRLELHNYRATVDKSKTFVLFEEGHRYFAQSGLIGEGLPNHRSVYRIVPGPRELGDAASIQLRLEADGADGSKVAKIFTFRRGDYLIDVTQEIEGPRAATAHAYFQLQRDGKAPEGESSMVSTFTGAAVYTDAEKYQKVTFDEIEKNKAKFAAKADNGWLAMVQHYFVAGWLPQPKLPREFYMRRLDQDLYATGVIVPLTASGDKASITVPLYAGPQLQSTLAKLATGFDLVVDYGWLTVIAAPIFWLLEVIHRFVGNWGWAIVALTVFIKLVFFPLSAASYKSMARMRQITPRLMALKERYGDDRQKLNTEMMELYRKEKINPLGGCLPILVQIPVFIALYWVLLASIELRHAPWLGWIQDLSAPDPYFILPVIYAISMFVQTKLNPQPADPVQARVMLIMPIVFSVFFLFFPSGLVLYWVVQNLLTIAQQWHINRTLEAEAKAKPRR